MLGWFSKDNGGSTFQKIDAAHSLISDARGRIKAVDAAHAEIDSIHTGLLKESSRLHAAADSLREKLNALLDTL